MHHHTPAPGHEPCPAEQPFSSVGPGAGPARCTTQTGAGGDATGHLCPAASACPTGLRPGCGDVAGEACACLRRRVGFRRPLLSKSACGWREAPQRSAGAALPSDSTKHPSCVDRCGKAGTCMWSADAEPTGSPDATAGRANKARPRRKAALKPGLSGSAEPPRTSRWRVPRGAPKPGGCILNTESNQARRTRLLRECQVCAGPATLLLAACLVLALVAAINAVWDGVEVRSKAPSPALAALPPSA